MKNKSSKILYELADQGIVEREALPALEQVAAQFNVALTPTITQLLEQEASQGPIYKQFVPQEEELIHTADELADPIGDQCHEKVKGLVHRYPDRCLLKVSNVCPTYCRFCFRKEMIGPGSQPMSSEDLRNAYDYIRNHSEIWEVILTGGDPLILNKKYLRLILENLEAIQHVDVVRIHTRIPIVDPAKIDAELLRALKLKKALYLVVHVNHPDELTESAIKACSALVEAGIPLLSQSVLLRGVNDSAEILTQLFKTLVKHRIKPYYLHHPDLVRGTAHFRMSIKEGQAIVKQLQGSISGLCQPTYVVDLPNGGGKVPLTECYCKPEKEGGWTFENFKGELWHVNWD